MKGRLDRILSACGLLTRSEAQSALRAGRVTVDGRPARDGSLKLDSETAVILLDGARVEGDGFVYLMLYKPAGVLSATEDRRGEQTALDLLPEAYRRRSIGVAGRLDKDAEGLLFLTDNGQLNHRLTSPRHHMEKRYLVSLDRPAEAADEAAFAAPMDLGDFVTQPAKLARMGDGSRCLVTLREGKFHQIKRMFAHQGKTVTALKRLSVGPLLLDERLPAGGWRRLEEAERRALFSAAEMV